MRFRVDRLPNPGILTQQANYERRRQIFTIPGTRRVERLTENLGALHINHTRQDVAALDEAVLMGVAAGARYAV